MPLTYEYIIRGEGRDGVRHNEYIMRLQALHTNYFRRQSGGYHYLYLLIPNDSFSQRQTL